MISENKLPPLASVPNEHQRHDANTFASLPQWAKVIVKEEFFYYFSNNETSNFAYLKNINLYWRYYFIACKLGKGISLLSSLRLFMSGLLFTTEYFSKLTYDSIVSLSKLRKPHVKSSKEKLIDIMLGEYLEFLKNNDWYEFDFFSRIKAYIKYDRQPEENLHFSEIEKNIFLIGSFSFKQVIATIIKIKNKINYTPSNRTTVIELQYYPPEFEYNIEINVIGEYQKHILLELPRYRGIKEYLRKISLENKLFSIAGNTGNIVVSCLFKDDIKPAILKITPLAVNDTNSRNETRVLYCVPIELLQGFIRYCHNKKISVENILDF